MTARLLHGITILLAAGLGAPTLEASWSVEAVEGAVERSGAADDGVSPGDELPPATALWLQGPADRLSLQSDALRAWTVGTAALLLGPPRAANTEQIAALELIEGALRFDSGDAMVLLSAGSEPLLVQGDIWLRSDADGLTLCIVDGRVWVNAAAATDSILLFDERYACAERQPTGWEVEYPSGLVFNQRLAQADAGARPVYMEDIRAAREREDSGRVGQEGLFRLPEP